MSGSNSGSSGEPNGEAVRIDGLPIRILIVASSCAVLLTSALTSTALHVLGEQTWGNSGVWGLLAGGITGLAFPATFWMLSGRSLRTVRRIEQFIVDANALLAAPTVDAVWAAPGELPTHGLLPTQGDQALVALEKRMLLLQGIAARFHAIADYTYGVEAWFNPEGRLIWVNSAIERVTGYTPMECLLAPDLAALLVYEKDRSHLLSVAREISAQPQGEHLELRLRTKAGSLTWVALSWRTLSGPGAEALGIRVSADDIQHRKEIELRLLETVAALRREQGMSEYYLTLSKEERSRLLALLDRIRLGVLFVDREHRVIFLNRAFHRIWNIPEGEDFVGARVQVLLERGARLRVDEQAFNHHVAEMMKLPESNAPYQFDLRDGRVLTLLSALVQGTEPVTYVGRVWIFEDVTERVRTAERLQQIADRDPLTNLYNRRRFHEELERLLADATRRGGELGLLMMDLDGFKPINDRYGHPAGDAVLVEFSRAVASIIRRNEMFFRLGGDEFAVLVPETELTQTENLARRIVQRVHDLRFTFGEQSVGISVSLGIGLSPVHATDQAGLIGVTDQALYRAKAGGKNGWRFAEACSVKSAALSKPG